MVQASPTRGRAAAQDKIEELQTQLASEQSANAEVARRVLQLEQAVLVRPKLSVGAYWALCGPL